jgi:hypothetical protein
MYRLLILPAACFPSDPSHLASALAQSVSGTQALRDALMDSQSRQQDPRLEPLFGHAILLALTMIAEFGRFARRKIQVCHRRL